MLDLLPGRAPPAPAPAISAPCTSPEPAAGALTLTEIAPVWSAELHCFLPPGPQEMEAAAARFGLPLPAGRKALTGNGLAIFSIGPMRWLLLSGRELSAHPALIWPDEASGAVISLMQGRALLALSGAASRDVLAKGTSIDLHPQVFRQGDCAVTALAQTPVTLARLKGDDYLVCVPRSYAQWLWDWLLLNAAEFEPCSLPPQPFSSAGDRG